MSNDSVMLIFGKRLKELRIEAKLTQKQLAEILNFNHASVGFWENAQRQCTMSTVVVIAKYFGVSTDFLLGLKDY